MFDNIVNLKVDCIVDQNGRWKEDAKKMWRKSWRIKIVLAFFCYILLPIRGLVIVLYLLEVVPVGVNYSSVVYG